MKRITALVATLLLTALLAACSSGGGTAEDDPASGGTDDGAGSATASASAASTSGAGDTATPISDPAATGTASPTAGGTTSGDSDAEGVPVPTVATDLPEGAVGIADSLTVRREIDGIVVVLVRSREPKGSFWFAFTADTADGFVEGSIYGDDEGEGEVLSLYNSLALV